jgi:hypothetical protein
VPLVGESGQPVTVSLGGVQTLRLRQGSSLPAEGAVYCNYLVFVPPADQCTALEYAGALSGPWLGDWTARPDWDQRTVTANRPPSAVRFFRTNFEYVLRITGLSVAGEKLIFKVELTWP